MKLSRRDVLLTSAASVAAGLPIEATRGLQTRPKTTTNPQRQAMPSRRGRSYQPNLSVRDYLAREARRITDNALSDLKSSADFNRRIAGRRTRFMDMMGLAALEPVRARQPVPVHVTGVVDRPAYRIEKLHYESLPNLHVTANLYVPKSIESGVRRPGVLYVCGHYQNQKVYCQPHPKRFAELGFPTLIAETVQLGEVTGYHHGCYREGWFHWYSRGYSPAAIELLNGIRGLDLLAARAEVDPDRLAVTGISGGGAATWWIAAADHRIKACAPVCGTCTLASHIYDRVIDGHCDCMWWVNTAQWDLADVGALIAPRPLLIASANQDGIFPIEAIKEVHSQLETLYRTLGRPQNLRFVETPGGHSYHERSRTAIFSWFLKHLMERDVPPGQVGDIELDETKLESADTLRVYTNGSPAGNRTVIIQGEFIRMAPPPEIRSANDVPAARAQLVHKLRSDTFNHFPPTSPPLDVVEEFALDGGVGSRFAFTSENGWRLHGVRRNPDKPRTTAPAVIILTSPGEGHDDSDDFASRLRTPWIRVVVETRGTGDTSWGEDLNWHIRRASAWTGRTIASMRVWDTLRALEAVRALSGVEAAEVALAARDEMSAVALYAALLDGRVARVFLESPPASQDVASQPNGKGPAIEMLNCLRYTDLAHVAGLLYPAEVVISGEFPASFTWADDLYRRLGSPGRFHRVKSLSDWGSA